MPETNGSAAFDARKARGELALIAQDMADQARGDDSQHGAVIARLAEICLSVLDASERRFEDVEGQVGLITRKLRKVGQAVAMLADEERKPVAFKDFLPEGPEHLHTGDDGPCWGKDCFTVDVKDLSTDEAAVAAPGPLRVEALLAILNQPAFAVDGKAAFRMLVKLPDFADGYYDSEGVAEVRLWGGIHLSYDGQQWVSSASEAVEA